MALIDKSHYPVRHMAHRILNFALVFSSFFMIWKSVCVLTNCPSPVVVVLSGSMEPAFHRGDLIFLWNRNFETQIGEIVVYNVKGKDIPIVHRVINRSGGGDAPLRLLTKGDNNQVDDTGIYEEGGTDFLDREDVVGSVVGYVPFVGYVTIALSEKPWVKPVALGLMGLVTILQQEG